MSFCPSTEEVRKVAAFAFRQHHGSSRDARGLEFSDMVQEIWLAALEVVNRHPQASADYVYASLWNRARNIRSRARTCARFSADEVPEDVLGRRASPEPGAEEVVSRRQVVGQVLSGLADVDRQTLGLLAFADRPRALAETGLSSTGWWKRCQRARERAREII